MKTIPIIQHQDSNKSARDYSTFDGKLLVTSVFRTLQGEGPFSGMPAIFIRLAGCNYGSKTDFCHFCDTSFEYDGGAQMTAEEALNLMVSLEGYRPTDVLVITGGEPTLQLALLELVTRVHIGGYFAHTQIETNGTQPRFFSEAMAQGIVDKIDFVVSPKANIRLGKYPPLHELVSWWTKHIKFVVSADPENPHHAVPEWALTLSGNKTVWVSPMTVYKKAYTGEVSSVWDGDLIDQKATAANYAYAAAYALKHNLRLSVQVHTLTAIP